MADDKRQISPDLTWLQCLYIEFIAERYEVRPVLVVSSIIREYIVKHLEVNLDDFAAHIREREELRVTPAQTKQMLSDVDAFKSRRAGVRPETPPTPPAKGYARQYRLKESGPTLSLALIDYAVLDFYSVKSSQAVGQIVRQIMRAYMIADKRLKMDEFRGYIDAACKELKKDAIADIEASWSNFLDQRAVMRGTKRLQRAV